jgi:hypothetical protein
MAHKESNGESRESASVRHAQWVRQHPKIEESGFPEYPDERARRGSSRGAVPNGNPWRPVNPDEKPGRDENAGADFVPDTLRTGTARPPNDRQPAAAPPRPLGAPTLRPATLIAGTEADERIAREIGEVLSHSKSLEGYRLTVEVTSGDVHLRGAVRDVATRSEVEQLCSSVKGVQHIHNELDVESR